MAKLHSYRILSRILAVLATIAFILACGDGEIVNFDPINMGLAKDVLEIQTQRIKEEIASEPESSSSEDVVEESSSSEETPGSSSEEQASSSSSPSSSSVAPSSSSESLYTLTCKVIVSTGAAYAEIPRASRPEVKCIEKANPTNVKTVDPIDVKWTDAPAWGSPPPGVYNNIYAEVFDDAAFCPREKAKCEGTLTITAPPSSSSRAIVITPSSSSTYVPPTTTSSSSRASTTSSSSAAASGGGACTSGETRGNMCLWNAGGDCWPLNSSDRTNCGTNAWIFQGGTEGKGTACSGGTFICGKNNNPPTSSAPSIGCCRWADQAPKCWDVYTQEEKNDCSGSSTDKYWSQSCPDKDGGCPN